MKEIKWDAHSCPSLSLNADLSFLYRYKKSGINFVSLNVGFALNTKEEIFDLIFHFVEWIESHSQDFYVAKNSIQITDYKNQDKTGIAFDVEGCDFLVDDFLALSKLYDLGVRQMLFAYNKANRIGGGCLENDLGLSKYGRQLVKKFNEVGMVIDCSHLGYQTSMEIMNLSDQPVVFSHSNPKGVFDHPRNIKDEQITACAANGGVIGINGVGIFLGNNEISSSKIVEHIDYIVEKVGSDHVGLGLDSLFASQEEMDGYINQSPDSFPVDKAEEVCIAQPEQFFEIANLLKGKGYSPMDINKILGRNFLRIASVVWK